MRKELDEALVRDFPNLYKERHGSPRETCMCWGFPGDGWEPLIRRLSERLEPLGVVADQVKEKFGTLRFYIESTTEEQRSAYDFIHQAEAESAVTCEDCGASGSLRGREAGRAWVRTLCDGCHERV